MAVRKYYLGLDMGTNSVGWAVTDDKYNILRAKGKDLWGIREFDEAAPAVERRTNRISRRRRQRETARIGMLKSYFVDEIGKYDPCFYARLENSKYYLEDKDESVRTVNAVFNDDNFKDADYFKAYPTIFHLRKAIIEDKPETHDVRLIYLAILNMFKHRGHFLNKNELCDGEETSILKLYNALRDSLSECEIILTGGDGTNFLELPEISGDTELHNILTDQNISRKAKAEKLAGFLSVAKKQKQHYELLKGMCGLKMNLSALFGEEIVDEEGNKTDIGFNEGSVDDVLIKLADILSEEQYELILSLKEIYSAVSVQGILKGHQYLSFARVEDYDKHHSDLILLKKYLKSNSMNDYNRMFRSDESGSYSAYVNSCNSSNINKKYGNAPKRRGIKERTQEAFYAYVKKMIKDYPDSEDKKYILEEIEKESFLPKQLTASNGVIPNQIHARELKAILKNAEAYLPFLTEADESGLTVSERILQLFTFTIPYYIGPLTENSAKNNGTGWVVRKENGRVLPWNIRDKVDFAKTRDGFIDRLIRNCSYLGNERVLPKASLMYESFCVLNEINNIKICGEKLNVATKQRIYTELFEKGKKVKRKAIEDFLISNGLVAYTDRDKISGIDIEINNSLSSYGKMKAVFGEKLREDKYLKLSEEIIRLCTIYGDDKAELKKLLAEQYAQDKDSTNEIVLTAKDINRIAGYKFSDWGRLSKEFLTLPGADKETGEIRSIIRALWETNDNLMELLSDRYTYQKELEERCDKQTKTLSEMTIDDLDGMYFSAPVKRMVWQTLRVIKELEAVMGGAPDKIFVEMARSEEKNKERKDSRAKKFTELYKNIKDDKDWIKFIEEKEKDGSIRSKKIYLYLTQMGRSMYTGKEINLSEIDRYDIDHIYPRHFVKDDNIANNLVLVEKTINNHKQDVYPIEEGIRHGMLPLWRSLLEKGLITKEKFDRLTSNRHFTEDQLADFIARQLVETRQGTKGVANILQEIMPASTRIVFAKAGNVSDFRRDNELLKSRTVNDMHHAHDAYLNIVVGNVYDTKFTQDPKKYILDCKKDNKPNDYNLGKMFEKNVVRNSYTAWTAGESGTISTVKKTMAKPSTLLTRMSFTGHGGIAEQTLYSKTLAAKSPDAYIPLKSKDERLCDVSKYGGFSSASTAYFTLVEYIKKGKLVRSIEVVPVYLKDKIERDESILLNYLTDKTGGEHLTIRYKKIGIQSLIKLNGYYAYITGKTLDRLVLRNATMLIFDQETVNYIKKLENESIDGLSADRNVELYNKLIDKHTSSLFRNRPNPIYEIIKMGLDKFKALNIEEQKFVLLEILRTTSIGGSGADLKLIGAAAKTGVTLTNKVISNNTEFKLIEQSVTGIYEKEIDLLTV